MRHLDDYRCALLCGILRGSFQETVYRKTAENTVKHRGGFVGSVVANHRSGGESSIVVTTLEKKHVLSMSPRKDREQILPITNRCPSPSCVLHSDTMFCLTVRMDSARRDHVNPS